MTWFRLRVNSATNSGHRVVYIIKKADKSGDIGTSPAMVGRSSLPRCTLTTKYKTESANVCDYVFSSVTSPVLSNVSMKLIPFTITCPIVCENLSRTVGRLGTHILVMTFLLFKVSHTLLRLPPLPTLQPTSQSVSRKPVNAGASS